MNKDKIKCYIILRRCETFPDWSIERILPCEYSESAINFIINCRDNLEIKKLIGLERKYIVRYVEIKHCKKYIKNTRTPRGKQTTSHD